MAKLFALVDAGKVKAVIVAKLDRLTRSVKDLCGSIGSAGSCWILRGSWTGLISVRLALFR